MTTCACGARMGESERRCLKCRLEEVRREYQMQLDVLEVVTKYGFERTASALNTLKGADWSKQV